MTGRYHQKWVTTRLERRLGRRVYSITHGPRFRLLLGAVYGNSVNVVSKGDQRHFYARSPFKLQSVPANLAERYEMYPLQIRLIRIFIIRFWLWSRNVDPQHSTLLSETVVSSIT